MMACGGGKAMTKPRVLVFTGEGKGKTTAALGMVCRALGHGQQVLVVQFVKGRESGEEAVLAAQPGVVFIRAGLGFLPREEGPELEQHRQAAQIAWQRAASEMRSGSWQMVVLDEICTAVRRGLLAAEEVAGAVRQTAPGTTLVLTGRDAAAELVKLADTVTEMRCIKHGYETGMPAQQGVEW